MADVLKIENLHVSFDTYAGEVHAVRGVSLHVGEGEVLAIVGESGCGKSVTAQTIMKLNPMPRRASSRAPSTCAARTSWPPARRRCRTSEAGWSA